MQCSAVRCVQQLLHMPNKVVNVDLQSASGATPRDTYSDLVIIGDEATTADPTTNRPKAYNQTSDVENEYGTDSDVATSSDSVQSKGAEAWWVLMADYSEHNNELITDSDTTSVSTGAVSNTPIRHGVDNITVTLDGTDQTVVPTTETPPTQPASGEVAVNFDTGELAVGDSSSGSGPGIEVTYDTLDWGQIKDNMEEWDLDIACFADLRADKSIIGDLDELVTYAEGHEMSVVIAYDDLSNYESQEAAREAYHDIGSYVPSKALLPIGHGSSSGDVAGEQAGRLAVKPPWFDPFWDAGAGYGFETDYFREAMIGEPGEPNTLEGGDSNEEGPVNVIKTEAGTKLLSNSLTTAGANSNYQYFDVYRTETFVAEEVENALTELQLSNEQIPFAPNGRTMIVDALRSRLRQYVTSGQLQTVQVQENQNNNNEEQTDEQQVNSATATRRSGAPLSDLRIRVPRHGELASADRQNRVWSGIRIEGVLSSNAHTFSVTLDVQM